MAQQILSGSSLIALSDRIAQLCDRIERTYALQGGEDRTRLNYFRGSASSTNLTASNTAILTDNAACPNGLVNALKVNENGTSNTSYSVSQSQSGRLIPAGSAACFSCYAKAGERRWLYVTHQSYTGGALGVYYDLQTGTATQGANTLTCNTAYGITYAGDGWWRIYSAIGDLGSGTNALSVGLYTCDNVPSVIHTGIVGSGLYLWGMQWESRVMSPGPYITSAANSQGLAYPHKTELQTPMSPSAPTAGGVLVFSSLPEGPDYGTLQIGTERIAYYNRRVNAVTIAARGVQDTPLAGHGIGDPVLLDAGMEALGGVMLADLVGDGVTLPGTGPNPLGAGMSGVDLVLETAKALAAAGSSAARESLLQQIALEHFTQIDTHLQARAGLDLSGTRGTLVASDVTNLAKYLQWLNTGGQAFSFPVSESYARRYWALRGSYLPANAVMPSPLILRRVQVISAATDTHVDSDLQAIRRATDETSTTTFAQGMIGQYLRARVTRVGTGTVNISVTTSGQKADGTFYGQVGDPNPNPITLTCSNLSLTAVGNTAQLLATPDVKDRPQEVLTCTLSGTGVGGEVVLETIPDRLLPGG
jgi:hypothetical protein